MPFLDVKGEEASIEGIVAVIGDNIRVDHGTSDSRLNTGVASHQLGQSLHPLVVVVAAVTHTAAGLAAVVVLHQVDTVQPVLTPLGRWWSLSFLVFSLGRAMFKSGLPPRGPALAVNSRAR